MEFKLKAAYSPAGDQAQSIEKLSQGVVSGSPHQVLLGVTGSGKTYTLANVIAKTQKPTLIISHNKTLAAQLYQEFKEYFPQNGVGFFISYYDYFQPEAYIPQTDTYIAKETDVNQEIEKLRLQATSLLFSRRDVIIVASVSCIYNLGSPTEYGREVIEIIKKAKIDFGQLINQLVDLNYIRTRFDLSRGTFRVRGGVLEVFPAYGDEILKIEAESGIIKEISLRQVFSGQKVSLDRFVVYPAKHFVANKDTLGAAFKNINTDLKDRLKQLNQQNKMFEAHRLEQKVKYDLEMIQEAGYVNGIENYSRYFDGRQPGDPPWSLISYFSHVYGQDFLVIIDESHISVPQIRGMYRGDLSRKKTLIDFGFRLPSCLDNRPLKFAEFLEWAPQIIYDSATPGDWEIKQAKGVVEQLIRPTGLVDPEIITRPAENQVKDLLSEILKRKTLGQRVLVTTLTKKMAEELACWLADIKNTHEPIQVHYLHADIKTLERSDILTDLRTGKYDVVVGVNLLREGLDLPEVSLVAILDADKQGFLRSKISLIQTMGRAARHITGKVILYADEESQAMKEAIKEVNRRRQVQLNYNQINKITPQGISKPIRERIVPIAEVTDVGFDPEKLTPGDAKKLLPKLRRQMREAASILDFEKAAQIRDMIREISNGL